MTPLESLRQRLAPLFPGLMGITLTEVGAERVVATMTVRPDLCTSGALLHGGALMAFADTLGAVGAFVNIPEGARIESSTKFIGGAPAGAVVIGESTPFHRGRTTQVWQTQIKSEAGKLLGVVTQTQLVIPAAPR